MQKSWQLFFIDLIINKLKKFFQIFLQFAYSGLAFE